MAHSRWDQLRRHGLPAPEGTWAEMITFHQGYMLAIEDMLEDLDDHGPESSEYPHHAIRHLLNKSLDEATTSLQAARELSQGDNQETDE